MARRTPTPNRWVPSANMANRDETRPLLDATAQRRVIKVPARHVISKKTQQTSFPIDRGFLPWVQVLGGWILFANGWGMPNLFGTFQTFYVTELLPSQTASSIAWIGSIQLFLTTLMCLFGGIFIDRGYLQSLIAAGTALQVAGLLATSFSTRYWQLFLAQGICVGIGSGLLGLLPVAVIAMYFEEKRMLATGIAATGASLAGVVTPVMLRFLFSAIGFAWSVRVLALVILVSNAFPWLAMRLQSDGADNETKFTLKHFRDPAYSTFCASFALMMAATFAPFFYIQEYAINLGATDNMAFGLLAIMNAANLFGRFVPNTLADRYGGINVLLPMCVACTILLAFLPLAHTVPALIVLSILYGFASGGVMILPAPIIANMTPKPSEMGVRMGLAYLCAAFGGLTGTPVSGAVKNEGSVGAVKEFRGVWWAAALIMAASVAALMATRKLRLGSFFGRGVA